MRSRLGLGFTAVRDDPTAAASLGVDVVRSKRIVFVVAAMGSGLAGAIIAANTLRVQPESIYRVNYAAFMIFMVVIGGVGTVEGPMVGAWCSSPCSSGCPTSAPGTSSSSVSSPSSSSCSRGGPVGADLPGRPLPGLPRRLHPPHPTAVLVPAPSSSSSGT